MGKVPTLHPARPSSPSARRSAPISPTSFPAGLAPPPGSRLRGPYYRWLFFVAGPIRAANTNKTLGVVVPIERAAMVGYGSQERTLGAVEEQLKRPEYIAATASPPQTIYIGSHIRLA